MKKSVGEEMLKMHIAAHGLPKPIPQYKFCKTRRWTFDFAYPDKMLAIEVEGGTWMMGRHSRGSGYEKDCEKYNTAALEGWRLLRFTTGMVKSGIAVNFIEKVLATFANAEKIGGTCE